MAYQEKDIFIVGVGAAAGGLTAIPEFLSSFDPKVRTFSVIIAQHHIQDDEHTEHLATIIKKIVKWPFEMATHGKEIEPGKIYLAPTHHHITVAKKSICLGPANGEDDPAPSINLFFESLAKELKSRCIGVLLSGYGSDGSEGAKAIKEKNGYVICQTPGTTEYNDMPEAAIVDGYSDIDLPPGQIFHEIIEYIDSQKIALESNKKTDKLHLILESLTRHSSIDFSFYKPTTLQRRIAKRLDALEFKDINAYYEYVKNNPEELEVLFKSFLIGVTEFFRNKESFELLKSYLTKLVDGKRPGDTIRVWSVGCSRGQEAYSIAILLREILKDSISRYKVQIFATDIDSTSLAIARKGTYKEDDIKELDPGLVRRYFDKNNHKYEVKKEIRQNILFSKHDIITDPPFIRLDLIICRNLLIYFNNDLQRETLRLFHYVLNKKGLLFLGKSESISVASDLYEIIDNRNKLFSKGEGSSLYSLPYGRFRRFRPEMAEKEILSAGLRDFSLTDNAKETLHSIFEHPYVIINDLYQIKKVQGSVRLYLEVKPGNMDANLFKMVNPEFTVELRALLAQCKKTKGVIQSKVIKFHIFDTENYVRLKVAPLVYQIHESDHFMVIFEKMDIDPRYIQTRQFTQEEVRDIHLHELEDELATAREHIQAFTEELETSNEELQSLNEELQSANEELKSANEELETSNEELQSANEELNTANSELKKTNDELLDKELELKSSKDQLEKSELLYRTLTENLPEATVGLVNREYEIQFVAGRDLERYNLRSEDLKGKKIFQRMEESAVNTLKQLIDAAYQGQKVSGITYHKGTYYKAHMLPFYEKNTVESVMFLNINITEQRNMINQLQESEARFKHMSDTAPVMIWMSGTDKKCHYFNKVWLDFTGRTLEQEVSDGWAERVHPDDLDYCMKIYSEAFDKREVFQIEYRLQRHDDEYLWILDQGVPRYDPDGTFLGYIGSCMDINAIKELENKKDEFINIASHELKTPLATALAYFQLVRESLQKEKTHEMEVSFVNKAIDSLQKLALLVDELLDISRMESGRLKLKEEELDFDRFVANVVTDYSKISKQHTFKIKGGSGKKIRGDKRLLEQVLFNLFSNAIKFSPDHPEVEILIGRENESVMLEVKDKGIGIAKNDLERIFEPFMQTSDKQFRKGLGLGLFICKGIVEKHGGTIYADSQPGQGSSIAFLLPVSNN